MDYYVSKASTSDDSNDGLSASAAFRTVSKFLTDASLATTGNRVLLRCGDTFDESLDAADTGITSAGSGWTMESFGSGDLPTVTRAMRNPTWTADDYGTWSLALSGNYGGFASEDGAPMRPVEWDTDLETTAAQMGPGDMTFDYTNHIYYIKPGSGTPAQHYYIVSAGFQGLHLQGATGGSFITIRGIRCEYATHGMWIQDGSGGVTIEDCEFALIGGGYTSGVILGDGITMINGVGPGPNAVRRCKFSDIFDCALFPQVGATASQ